jgi:hypothetical protein
LFKELLDVLAGSQKYTLHPVEAHQRLSQPKFYIPFVLGLMAGAFAFWKSEQRTFMDRLWAFFYLGGITFSVSAFILTHI